MKNMNWCEKEYACGCEILTDGMGTYGIRYCPKHKSAPDLYEACKVAQIWLEGLVRVNPKMLNSAGRQAVSNDLIKARAKADGGK